MSLFRWHLLVVHAEFLYILTMNEQTKDLWKTLNPTEEEENIIFEGDADEDDGMEEGQH